MTFMLEEYPKLVYNGQDKDLTKIYMENAKKVR